MQNDDAYRKQVLKTFFKNGMLLKIPEQNRKKDVVLQKISSKLLPGRMYSETELEEILAKLTTDFKKLNFFRINSGVEFSTWIFYTIAGILHLILRLKYMI